MENFFPGMSCINDPNGSECNTALEYYNQNDQENIEPMSSQKFLDAETSNSVVEYENIEENSTRKIRQVDPDYVDEYKDTDESEEVADNEVTMIREPDNKDEKYQNITKTRQVDPDYVEEYEDTDESEEDANNELSLIREEDSKDEEYKSNTVVNNKRKRRKRHDVKEGTWRENTNKKMREEGKEYRGKKKTDEGWNYDIKKERRVLKSRCNCKISSKSTSIQCSKLTDLDRRDIFKYFWNNLDWNQRQIYVDMLIKIAPTKRQRNRKLENQSRRSITWQYYLKKSETEIRVCKNMFLNTLNIGERSVKTWKQKLSGTDYEDEDNEDSTVNSRLRRNEEGNRIVIEFFENIPKMESHYCRATTSKLYLEPQWFSKSALYKFYKTNWCAEKQSDPVSIATFHHIFNSMNLSLFKPKKDQCDTCVAHDTGNLSEEIYETHQQKKKEAREAKEIDKSSDHKVFCMDLQSVLLSPKSNVSSSYFKTKLIVHNFTIFDMKTKDGYCFIWHESSGGVASNDYSSIICNFLENSVIPNISSGEKIILYSDGCTSQNRNAVLANSLLNLSMLHKIVIEQKYLEKGHTQMEADSMHATIERKIHNRVINVPADYVGICLHAREKPRPYVVKYLAYKFFKNFDGLKFFTSLRPGRKQGDPVVTDLRALKYSPNGDVHYKLRHPDEYTKFEFRQVHKQLPVVLTQLPPLYLRPIPIKKEKWTHLQQLKSSISNDYHSFYDNLPCQ